jgi:thiosulfate reductase / polysulfide reductase chain A
MRRREFIRIASATGAAAGGAGLLGNWYGLDASPLPDPHTDGDHVVPSFCELCFWKCGILAHVKDGRVTKITGNPRDPLSRGRLCPRGAGGTGLLYDPDRLKRPMIRSARRGAQVFDEVSWDDALGEVATRFERIRQRYGPGAVALFSHGFGGSWMKHLFRAWGSGTVAEPSFAQCRGPREVGFELTFGNGVFSPEPTDMANARCIVLIGSHLGENMHNTQVQEFATAIRKGADVIAVDPRFSVAASKARHWLPIKPGTDLALLLAWMHVLVTENLFDREYVERYATGLPQLRTHLAPFTPEWAYPRTGIAPELIRDTAHLMAGARPAVLVHPGRHVTWYGNDAQRSRAIAMLNVLLGSWGRRGGFFMPAAADVPRYPYPAYRAAPVAAADRASPGAYPFATELLAQGVRDASIPGGVAEQPTVRGWMVNGSNLLTAVPDPRRTERAIQELEFLVTIDVVPAEIAGWSDVVLPEATYLERCDELFTPAFREPYLALRQEVVPPLFDSKPGWWIAKELSARLGLREFFPWQTSTESAQARVRAAGLDWNRLRREGVIATARQPIYYEDGVPAEFPTPSGKIELYSPQLLALGFDPMPTWRDGELEEPPAGFYRLLTGRAPVHTFGRSTNNRLLSEVYSENEIWVHTTVAARFGLRNGERVHLRNQDGVLSTFTAPVKVTPRIHPDAVYLVHGYGHTAHGLRFARGRGIDDNELVTRTSVDPLMGGTGMNVNFVTFVRPGEVTT